MAKRLDAVEEKFLNTVKENNLIDFGDKIVVGVSGGPDSLTLLSLLLKYKEKFNIEIIVAHVNHLIRKDSTEDEQFVENFCKKNGVKFYCKRVNVLEIAKKEKKGTEEVGRKERYKFFREICKKENANKIAIAHNMNDNAETMILKYDVDMVINIGRLKAKEYDFVENDIRAVVEASGDKLVKVIIETCLLTDEEKEKACQLSVAAGADYVKTSTGFSTAGANVHDVALMRKTVGPNVGVKAAGGARSYADAEAFVKAGATRIGASSGVAIVNGETAAEGSY